MGRSGVELRREKGPRSSIKGPERTPKIRVYADTAAEVRSKHALVEGKV